MALLKQFVHTPSLNRGIRCHTQDSGDGRRGIRLVDYLLPPSMDIQPLPYHNVAVGKEAMVSQRADSATVGPRGAGSN